MAYNGRHDLSLLPETHDRSPFHEEVLLRRLPHSGVLEAEAGGEMNESQLAALTEEEQWLYRFCSTESVSGVSGPHVSVQTILTALADARLEVARLTEERDLAIAHDRQPYPTADAYERVCVVRDQLREDIRRLVKMLQTTLMVEREHDGHSNPDDRCWCQAARKLLAEMKDA